MTILIAQDALAGIEIGDHDREEWVVPFFVGDTADHLLPKGQRGRKKQEYGDYIAQKRQCIIDEQTTTARKYVKKYIEIVK